MEERLRYLEKKLNNIVFLDGCENIICSTSRYIILDGIPDSDMKLRTLLKYYNGDNSFNPTMLCENIQHMFSILDMKEKLNIKELQHYVFGKTFNGVAYTTFTYDMVLKMLLFILSNKSTHTFNGVNLEPLLELKYVETLGIRNNTNLVDLTYVGKLTTLKKLELINCSSVLDLSPLKELTKLTKLIIIGNDKIIDLSCLETFVELVELYIMNCKNLVNLDSISNLQNLTKINFSGCSGLLTFDVLSELPELKILDVDDIKFESLEFLKTLTKLEELDIMTEIELPPIPTLIRLNGLLLN
jgi:Leucine-rich repeat (LRR) protein